MNNYNNKVYYINQNTIHHRDDLERCENRYIKIKRS